MQASTPTISTSTVRKRAQGRVRTTFVVTGQRAWKHASPIITNDDLVKAYARGLARGARDSLNEAQKVLLDRLVKNIATIEKERDSLAEFLSSKGFSTQEAFLRIANWNNFNLLFLVPEQDFVQDEFLDIYTQTQQPEAKAKKEEFHLSIGFINGTLDALEHERLKSDGYFFSYSFD